MKTDIKTCFDKIKHLLENNESLRNNDQDLFYAYFFNYHNITRITSFLEILLLINLGSAPTFETIRRSRQLVQAKYPELRATKEIQEFREQKEIEIKEQIKLI